MKCESMSIKLQADAVPISRRVPKLYEPESKKTITELTERKVIAEPMTWCSPGIFCAKGRRQMGLPGHGLHRAEQVHPAPNTSVPIHKGNHRGYPTRSKTILQARRSARILSAGPGRTVQQTDYLPHTAGALQIPTRPNGAEHFIGRMVPPVRRHHTRPPIRYENCRRHDHLGQRSDNCFRRRRLGYGYPNLTRLREHEESLDFTSDATAIQPERQDCRHDGMPHACTASALP